jgi:hypothetical protein
VYGGSEFEPPPKKLKNIMMFFTNVKKLCDIIFMGKNAQE